MTLKRLKAGQPLDGAISAGTWNAFVDYLASLGPDAQTYGGQVLGNGSRVIIQVKNSTAAALSPYQVVGLGAPAVAPGSNLTTFQQSICLTARTPLVEDADRFAIVASAIAIGEIGPAVLAGVVPVRVEMTQAWHRGAKAITADPTKLRSTAGGGARILWVESGTGTKWALVQFPFESPIKLLYASTDLEHNGTGDFALAQASAISGPFVASSDVVKVLNARELIWQGSLCLAASADFRSSVALPTDQLVIFEAWSATRIRGKAQGDISPGTMGRIEQIIAEDGHYLPAGGEADAWLPTEHVVVKDGMPCWAHLRWNSDTSATRWELYSADCDGAP